MKFTEQLEDIIKECEKMPEDTEVVSGIVDRMDDLILKMNCIPQHYCLKKCLKYYDDYLIGGTLEYVFRTRDGIIEDCNKFIKLLNGTYLQLEEEDEINTARIRTGRHDLTPWGPEARYKDTEGRPVIPRKPVVTQDTGQIEYKDSKWWEFWK